MSVTAIKVDLRCLRCQFPFIYFVKAIGLPWRIELLSIKCPWCGADAKQLMVERSARDAD